MPKFRHNAQINNRENAPKEVGNMVIVYGKDMDALSDALRRFRKKLKDSGVMDDLHKASFYVKPSKRRRERKHARAQQARSVRMQNKRKDKIKSGW